MLKHLYMQYCYNRSHKMSKLGGILWAIRFSRCPNNMKQYHADLLMAKLSYPDQFGAL
jgi:hypothetical protein